jgi:hypothetical protein
MPPWRSTSHLGHVIALVAIADVGDDRGDLALQARRRLVEGRPVATHEEHPGTRAREHPGDAAADAPAAPGDDHRAACDRGEHGRSSVLRERSGSTAALVTANLILR